QSIVYQPGRGLNRARRPTPTENTMRRTTRRLLLAAPLLLAAAVIGCNTPDSPPAGEAVKKKPGTKLPSVDVTEAKYAALDTALKEEKGSVVLVDFWATWCGPCVKKFPDLVALHQKYADQGLTCISVSMDDP